MRRAPFACAVALLFLLPHRAVAQRPPGPFGVPRPADVRAAAVTDTALAYLLAGIKVLKDTSAAHMQVRVLGAWGGWAGLECDCLLTNIYVVLNAGETERAVFKLSSLLDPRIERVATVDTVGVMIISYGLPEARHQVELRALHDAVSGAFALNPH